MNNDLKNKIRGQTSPNICKTTHAVQQTEEKSISVLEKISSLTT